MCHARSPLECQVGGMQVKTIIHQLLLSYRWTVSDGYEPTWEYGTGLYPADGLPVRLTG